jgi:hypothetical protein
MQGSAAAEIRATAQAMADSGTGVYAATTTILPGIMQ